MTLRFLVLLGFVASVSFAQFGLFGPVTGHLNAGDLAPEIVYTNILHAGDSSTWRPSRSAGKFTVIVFFPDTSDNSTLVTAWSTLVDQFSGQPIRFAWITSEDAATLDPFLEKHPIKGWMFLDADGATGRSYGLEQPATVIVGKDGRIVGFDRSFMPAADTVKAVLEGRITTVPPEPNAANFKAFVESGKVLLKAEPPHAPGPGDHKPNIAPSYRVHISPSDGGEGGNFSGEDFRNLLNLDLKSAVAQIYNTNPARVVLPPALDDYKRYNFVIVLPKAETQEQLDNRLLHGIEDYFHSTTLTEQRMMDVYVVTSFEGRPPKGNIERSSDPNAGLSFASSVEFRTARAASGPDDFGQMPAAAGLADITGIAVEGTVDDFCRTLEQSLDRPVVNETKAEGEFRFRVVAAPGSESDFLTKLRDDFNLIIAPERRPVQVVAVKPR